MKAMSDSEEEEEDDDRMRAELDVSMQSKPIFFYSSIYIERYMVFHLNCQYFFLNLHVLFFTGFDR